MKALLKNGEWVEIETAVLFKDQYNTKDKRIFDKDIVRIVDDARVGMGKCRYCGALVKRGEEAQHFKERESRSCSGCFWNQDRLISSTRNPIEIESTTNENGETVTRSTVVTVSKYERVCAHKEEHGGCVGEQCRQFGIEWFTPENTFFLRYSNGFKSIPAVDKLLFMGFDFRDGEYTARYRAKIGSYNLSAWLEVENGKATGISCFHLFNTRRSYTFRFEGGDLYTDKYSFGWRLVNTLEGVPAGVMEKIRILCGGKK